MKDKFIYFISGVLITIILFLSINATTPSASRYQHQLEPSILSILDTHTGIVKIYNYQTYSSQFPEFEIDYSKTIKK